MSLELGSYKYFHELKSSIVSIQHIIILTILIEITELF